MRKELIIVQTFDKDGFLTGYKVNGELVRCKDCKFNNRCLLQHFVRDNAVEAITDEWFCGDGRRSE